MRFFLPKSKDPWYLFGAPVLQFGSPIYDSKHLFGAPILEVIKELSSPSLINETVIDDLRCAKIDPDIWVFSG